MSTSILIALSYTGRTALLTTVVRRVARLPISSVPRQTREPSTRASVPSTGLASPAGDGPRAASSSRVSPGSSGKSHDGPLLRGPFLNQVPRTLPPPPPRAVTKRTRRTATRMKTKTKTATKATAFPRAKAAPMSRCRARPASKRRHQHPFQWWRPHKAALLELPFATLSFPTPIFSASLFLMFSASSFSFQIPCSTGYTFSSNLEKKSGSAFVSCFIGPGERDTGGYPFNIVPFEKATVLGRRRRWTGGHLAVLEGSRRLEYQDHFVGVIACIPRFTTGCQE